MAVEVTDAVAESALYGLKFAADKERLTLYAVRPEWIARVVASHAIGAAISTGHVVAKPVHDAAIEKLKRRAAQFESYWASEKSQADQQLQRAQAALADLEDRELAARLADKIGVLLHYEEDAA